MEIVYGVLAGLAWGAVIGLLNAAVSGAGMKKNSPSAIMAANSIRFIIDIAAFAAVFLLRGVLPFSYEAALIATAVTLSLLTIVTAFQLSKK